MELRRTLQLTLGSGYFVDNLKTPQVFFLRPPWRPAYIWPSLWLWKDISLSWNLFSEWRTSEIIGRKWVGGFSIQCLGVWDHLCSSPSREFCSLSASHFQIISCWKLSIIKTPFSRKSTRTKVTLRLVELNQTYGWKSILLFLLLKDLDLEEDTMTNISTSQGLIQLMVKDSRPFQVTGYTLLPTIKFADFRSNGTYITVISVQRQTVSMMDDSDRYMLCGYISFSTQSSRS